MARILSVEDDAEIQHLIGQVLFREGYEVHYAWNGQEGYEKILSVGPDLILLDLMLPILNGVELMGKLREDKAIQGIPVIIVSAYGDEANMLGHSVKALGAADYLRKPFKIQELVKCVKQVLTQFPRTSRPAAPSAELHKGSLRADPKFRTVWVNDRLVATLSYKEFSLLERLIRASGPVSKGSLLRDLGYEAHQADALKQTLHRLRQAFGPSENHRIITTPQGYEVAG